MFPICSISYIYKYTPQQSFLSGDLISDSQKFFSIIDDIALTWLFGMKIVISVGCRRQIVQRLERLHGTSNSEAMPGVRVTSPETLRILEEEAGFCRFEVERLLNRCLRNKGADCNVVSGCFITAKKFGVVNGVDYQVRPQFQRVSKWFDMKISLLRTL